jgi:hypothetical protein
MKYAILIFRCFLVVFVPFFFGGCVMQYQRQYLGDPIMYFNHDPEENPLTTTSFLGARDPAAETRAPAAVADVDRRNHTYPFIRFGFAVRLGVYHIVR